MSVNNRLFILTSQTQIQVYNISSNPIKVMLMQELKLNLLDSSLEECQKFEQIQNAKILITCSTPNISIQNIETNTLILAPKLFINKITTINNSNFLLTCLQLNQVICGLTTNFISSIVLVNVKKFTVIKYFGFINCRISPLVSVQNSFQQDDILSYSNLNTQKIYFQFYNTGQIQQQWSNGYNFFSIKFWKQNPSFAIISLTGNICVINYQFPIIYFMISQSIAHLSSFFTSQNKFVILYISSGTYIATQSFYCSPAGCGSIANLTGICPSCLTGLNYISSNNSCNCKIGLKPNLLGNQCFLCLSKCKTCSSNTTCSSCQQNAQLANNFTNCACNPGFVPTPDASNCMLICHSNCKTCSGNASDSCQTCQQNAKLVNNSCACVKGYFGKPNNCIIDSTQTYTSYSSFNKSLIFNTCQKSNQNQILNVYGQDSISLITLPSISQLLKALEVKTFFFLPFNQQSLHCLEESQLLSSSIHPNHLNFTHCEEFQTELGKIYQQLKLTINDSVFNYEINFESKQIWKSQGICEYSNIAEQNELESNKCLYETKTQNKSNIFTEINAYIYLYEQEYVVSVIDLLIISNNLEYIQNEGEIRISTTANIWAEAKITTFPEFEECNKIQTNNFLSLRKCQECMSGYELNSIGKCNIQPLEKRAFYFKPISTINSVPIESMIPQVFEIEESDSECLQALNDLLTYQRNQNEQKPNIVFQSNNIIFHIPLIKNLRRQTMYLYQRSKVNTTGRDDTYFQQWILAQPISSFFCSIDYGIYFSYLIDNEIESVCLNPQSHAESLIVLEENNALLNIQNQYAFSSNDSKVLNSTGIYQLSINITNLFNKICLDQNNGTYQCLFNLFMKQKSHMIQSGLQTQFLLANLSTNTNQTFPVINQGNFIDPTSLPPIINNGSQCTIINNCFVNLGKYPIKANCTNCKKDNGSQPVGWIAHFIITVDSTSIENQTKNDKLDMNSIRYTHQTEELNMSNLLSQDTSYQHYSKISNLSLELNLSLNKIGTIEFVFDLQIIKSIARILEEEEILVDNNFKETQEFAYIFDVTKENDLNNQGDWIFKSLMLIIVFISIIICIIYYCFKQKEKQSKSTVQSANEPNATIGDDNDDEENPNKKQEEKTISALILETDSFITNPNLKKPKEEYFSIREINSNSEINNTNSPLIPQEENNNYQIQDNIDDHIDEIVHLNQENVRVEDKNLDLCIFNLPFENAEDELIINDDPNDYFEGKDLHQLLDYIKKKKIQECFINYVKTPQIKSNTFMKAHMEQGNQTQQQKLKKFDLKHKKLFFFKYSDNIWHILFQIDGSDENKKCYSVDGSFKRVTIKDFTSEFQKESENSIRELVLCKILKKHEMKSNDDVIKQIHGLQLGKENQQNKCLNMFSTTSNNDKFKRLQMIDIKLKSVQELKSEDWCNFDIYYLIKSAIINLLDAVDNDCIVHGDIKPENLYISQENNKYSLILRDALSGGGTQRYLPCDSESKEFKNNKHNPFRDLQSLALFLIPRAKHELPNLDKIISEYMKDGTILKLAEEVNRKKFEQEIRALNVQKLNSLEKIIVNKMLISQWDNIIEHLIYKYEETQKSQWSIITDSQNDLQANQITSVYKQYLKSLIEEIGE